MRQAILSELMNVVSLPFTMKILVVDDDNSILEDYKGRLVDFFREDEIFICQTLAEAEEIMEKTNIDICLLNNAMVKDMTAKLRKQNKELLLLNEKVKDTQGLLIQKEKLVDIGELTAGVIHEINNPLTFVRSNFEVFNQYIHGVKEVLGRYRELGNMLQDERITHEDILSELRNIQAIEETQKVDFILADTDSLLKDSRAGIERIVKIVSSLKTFTRMSSDEETGCYSLNDIIGEALLFVKNEAKPNIEIETKFSPSTWVNCNQVQICQVVLNILLNAIHAIRNCQPCRSGKILIETLEENDFQVCRISDNGPGIPEDIIHHIFESFFTTKLPGQGTGLGLSICYDIITKKHSGEIFVQSLPDQGAIFTFKIPKFSHK